MPLLDPLTRTRLRRAAEWTAVAVALALGLHPPLQWATGKAPLPVNDISMQEEAFADIGRRVPSARMGWILPSAAPPGIAKMLVISQYALLPRRLKLVTATECAPARPAACGVDEVDVAVIPHFTSYDAAPAAAELGFDDASAAESAIVFAVRRR